MLVFFSSVENIFGSHLAFGPPVENFLWLGFLVEDSYSARKGPHPPVALRNERPRVPPTTTAAARATAAYLNRFGYEFTGGWCVFKCNCVRI